MRCESHAVPDGSAEYVGLAPADGPASVQGDLVLGHALLAVVTLLAHFPPIF